MQTADRQTEYPAVAREKSPRPIDPRVVMRHGGLKVADLNRARRFYVDVLGFNVMVETDILLLLSASGYHHELSLWARESKGGSPPPTEATGLDHLAFLYPTREALADALARVAEIGWPIEYVSDFPAHVGVHLKDPDGNMLEFQWDKPVEEWALDEDGHLPAVVKFISLEELMSVVGIDVPRLSSPPSQRDVGTAR